MAATATLDWSDTVAFGRECEEPGDLVTRLDVLRGGHPLLRQEASYGPDAPGWNGPGGLAGARVLRTRLTVGVPAPASHSLPLVDGEAHLTVDLAPSAHLLGRSPTDRALLNPGEWTDRV
jgi:hypothetical protein